MVTPRARAGTGQRNTCAGAPSSSLLAQNLLVGGSPVSSLWITLPRPIRRVMGPFLPACRGTDPTGTRRGRRHRHGNAAQRPLCGEQGGAGRDDIVDQDGAGGHRSQRSKPDQSATCGRLRCMTRPPEGWAQTVHDRCSGDAGELGGERHRRVDAMTNPPPDGPRHRDQGCCPTRQVRRHCRRKNAGRINQSPILEAVDEPASGAVMMEGGRHEDPAVEDELRPGTKIDSTRTTQRPPPLTGASQTEHVRTVWRRCDSSAALGEARSETAPTGLPPTREATRPQRQPNARRRGSRLG